MDEPTRADLGLPVVLAAMFEAPLKPSPVADAALCPSQMRLRRHADFQAVYKVARKQYAKEMSFFFAKRLDSIPANGAAPAFLLPPPPGPRIGLTVGKVLGKAHDRNRIKRRLRAAVRQHAALLGTLPVDVVLHPRRTVLTLDYATVEAEVAQAFRTVRRLADKPQVPSPPRDRSAKRPAAKNVGNAGKPPRG